MEKRALFILMIIIISVFSCKKDDVDDNNTDYEFSSFNASINGIDVIIKEDTINIFSNSVKTKSTGVIDDLIMGFYMSLGPLVGNADSIRNLINIEFNNNISLSDLDNNNDISEMKFRDLLKVGQYPFTYIPSEQSGVIVSYYDKNGVNWISDKYFSVAGNSGDTIPLIPDYTNFNFEIIESTTIQPPYPFYQWGQKLHINFDCYLYNINGDSIKIENAEFTGKYYY